MAQIGYMNRMVTEVYNVLIQDDLISKFMHYYKEKDIDIPSQPKVKNPVGALKKQFFKNRRIETLQRDANVNITINISRKTNWQDGTSKWHGKNSFENILEIGVSCHNDCDRTLNGSRTYALIDLIVKKLSGNSIDSLGEVRFIETIGIRDLNQEYSGYLTYFSVYGMKDEGFDD
ncbi:hypothetical protein [Peptostreptococcus faecalis]|uniref:hypothetical protein n=1 Tax=Peptostreptococcus faecalis TaxID=2045015 RepID=UPI000C7965AE|nr:hypothetical protein [Peptostreptococcus faecalis]